MNQLMTIYQQMKQGNPAAVFQRLLGNNPQAQPIIQALNGGTSIKSLVDAELQKHGMTREQAMNALKEQGLIQ